jgi:hypothetical protein
MRDWNDLESIRQGCGIRWGINQIGVCLRSRQACNLVGRSDQAIADRQRLTTSARLPLVLGVATAASARDEMKRRTDGLTSRLALSLLSLSSGTSLVPRVFFCSAHTRRVGEILGPLVAWALGGRPCSPWVSAGPGRYWKFQSAG